MEALAYPLLLPTLTRRLDGESFLSFSSENFTLLPRI